MIYLTLTAKPNSVLQRRKDITNVVDERGYLLLDAHLCGNMLTMIFVLEATSEGQCTPFSNGCVLDM